MILFDDLLRLRSELDRVTEAPPREARRQFPLVNIYDNGDAFLVRAEVPGVDKGALEITVKANQLFLRGERVVKPAHAQATYHRREREGGTFRRGVTLPERVDGDRVQATFKNGVLEVIVPRAADTKPRRIAIG